MPISRRSHEAIQRHRAGTRMRWSRAQYNCSTGQKQAGDRSGCLASVFTTSPPNRNRPRPRPIGSRSTRMASVVSHRRIAAEPQRPGHRGIDRDNASLCRCALIGSVDRWSLVTLVNFVMKARVGRTRRRNGNRGSVASRRTFGWTVDWWMPDITA